MVNKKANGDSLDAPNDWNSVADFIQKSIDNHALMRDKIARHDFIENLDELAMQGGFYDIFRDTSKIESQSNVIISTLTDGDNEGKITLDGTDTVPLTNTTTIDDFEDGSNSEWTDTDGTLEIESTNPINGTYSGRHTTPIPDSTSDSSITFTETSEKFSCKFRRDTQTGEINDSTNIQLYNGNDYLIQISFKDNGDIREEENFNTLGTWQTGTVYELVIDIDFTNDEATYYVNGSNLGTYSIDNSNNLSSYNKVEFRTSTVNTDETSGEVNAYIDDIEHGEYSLDYFSSGYITEREDLSSGDDDFSNPPVSVTVNQDADIPADEDIQFVVRDVNGSGADETVTQAQVGTQVDISDFTGFLVEVETQFSSSDGNDTPTLRSQDFYFEEGT